jgi:hypothetical protein
MVSGRDAFSLVDRLDLYLVVNLAVLNALWGVSAGYRKWVLVKKVRQR